MTLKDYQVQHSAGDGWKKKSKNRTEIKTTEGNDTSLIIYKMILNFRQLKND